MMLSLFGGPALLNDARGSCPVADLDELHNDGQRLPAGARSEAAIKLPLQFVIVKRSNTTCRPRRALRLRCEHGEKIKVWARADMSPGGLNGRHSWRVFAESDP